MSYFFNAEEILETAILIEQNGQKFYQAISDETKDKAVKKLSNRLRDDEKRHEETFSKLLKEYLSKKPPLVSANQFAESDAKYLKGLADANVFARTLSSKEIVSKVKTDQETIRFGMKIEKESIVFYAQMKKFTTPGWGREEIDKVILEEQEHYKILNKLLEDKINPRETC